MIPVGLFGYGAYNEALPFIEVLTSPRTRSDLMRQWGQRIGDWATVRDSVDSLGDRFFHINPFVPRPLHFELAVVYSHLGDHASARTHVQKASGLHGTWKDAAARIARLQNKILLE